MFYHSVMINNPVQNCWDTFQCNSAPRSPYLMLRAETMLQRLCLQFAAVVHVTFTLKHRYCTFTLWGKDDNLKQSIRQIILTMNFQKNFRRLMDFLTVSRI